MQKITKEAAIAEITEGIRALPARFAGCTICAMAAEHGDELEVLARSEHAVAVLDRYAVRKGHVLVVLRAHIERVESVPWEIYQDVQRLVWESSRAVARVFEPRRVFVASLGCAEAIAISYPHHHVHVVPVCDVGDGARPARVFTWSEGTLVYEPGEAREVANALRRAWG